MLYGLCCITPATDAKTVPLVRTDVNITVRPTGASVVKKLLFMNNSNEEVETEFRYPKEKGHVNGLRYRVEDGEWLSMNVEEKLEAEKKYHEAVSSGHQAAVGSQLSDNVFSIKIGRLRPYEMVWIEVNYFCELEWTDCYEYRHQLTMVPPYLMQDEDVKQYTSKAPKFNNGAELPYGVFMTIRCEYTAPFKVNVVADEIQEDIQSKENVVEIPRTSVTGKKDIYVQMYPTEMKPCVNITETDTHYYYQVSFSHSENDLGDATLVAEQVEDEQLKRVLDGYEVVETTSTAGAVETTSDTKLVKTYAKPEEKHYAFVVDGSGSMNGSAIKNSRSVLKIAIKQLPQGAKYMILVFGSNDWAIKNQFYPPALQNVEPLVVEPCHPGVACDGCGEYPIQGDCYHKSCVDYDLCGGCVTGVDASQFEKHEPVTKLKSNAANYDDKWATHTDESFVACNEWIDINVSDNYGGTEMKIAVDSVYDRLNGEKQNVMIMMTDAQIGDNQAKGIVSKAKNSDIKMEIFALGIGNGCSMNFLESMTNACQGVAFHVVDNKDINAKTQRIMQCATQSQFLRNLSFECPSHISLSTRKPVTSYFKGEPLNVFAQVAKSDFQGDETITLKSGDTSLMTLKFNNVKPSLVNLETVYHMTYLEQLLKFRDVYCQTYHGDDNTSKMTKDEYKKIVIELAVKYNIVTQYTSAVIVRQLTNPDGSKKLEKIDVPIANGADKSYPQTESSLGMACFAMSAPPMASRGFRGGMMKKKSMPMQMNHISQPMASAMYSDEDEDEMSFGMLDDSLGGVSGNIMMGSIPPVKEKNDLLLIENVSSTPQTISSANTIVTPVAKQVKLKPEELIEKLLLAQSGASGMWKYDEELVKEICVESVDKYKTVLESLTGFNEDMLMTLLVMAFMRHHNELYPLYAKSFRNAKGGLNNVDNLNRVLMNVRNVGLN